MDKKMYLLLIIISILIIGITLGLGLPCPFLEYFNIYCAGCGITRMFLAIFKLNFYQAFRYNPLVFILLIISFLYIIYYLICKIFHFNYYKIKNRDLYLLVAILIIYMILRNVPEFEALRPTIVS